MKVPFLNGSQKVLFPVEMEILEYYSNQEPKIPRRGHEAPSLADLTRRQTWRDGVQLIVSLERKELCLFLFCLPRSILPLLSHHLRSPLPTMVKVVLKPLDAGASGDIELPKGKTTLGRGGFLTVS